MSRLLESGLLRADEVIEPQQATREQLMLVHTPWSAFRLPLCSMLCRCLIDSLLRLQLPRVAALDHVLDFDRRSAHLLPAVVLHTRSVRDVLFSSSFTPALLFVLQSDRALPVRDGWFHYGRAVGTDSRMGDQPRSASLSFHSLPLSVYVPHSQFVCVQVAVFITRRLIAVLVSAPLLISHWPSSTCARTTLIASRTS